MQFPNDIQAAILFDRRVGDLEAIVRAFLAGEEARGRHFNMSECNPGVFYRLFGGGDELMITLEYMDQPANMDVFQQALASTVTGIVCPDIRQRLAQCRSHILVNVSHGVFGGLKHAFLDQIGFSEGQSLPQFTRRLDVLARLAAIVCGHAPASVVHWTQSNQLYPGEKFAGFADFPAPSPLHVHPYLFGGKNNRRGEAEAGILTFGVRHFIGREVIIEPHALPWAANYEVILAFLRVATVENGYVIPHEDTFGPDDHSLSYRVLHREPENGEVPLYELVPLMHREFGYQSPDYVPRDRIIDDRAPPANLVPYDEDERFELINEWREKRTLAERIGGKFEVRAKGVEPGGPPPRPGFGLPRMFGRKR